MQSFYLFLKILLIENLHQLNSDLRLYTKQNFQQQDCNNNEELQKYNYFEAASQATSRNYTNGVQFSNKNQLNRSIKKKKKLKEEFRYMKFFIYYGNHFTFSCLYILVNYFKPYLYNISHIIFVYAYSLNVTWGIYDQDFLKFDDRKTISYGYVNAFLLCSCIEGGSYFVKSFLFVTVGLLFILSDSYSNNNLQTSNIIRYVFPCILYSLKLRHEEIIKRQIFIQKRHIIDWANMIHKQLPTPFVIGKFNKKEERLEYYSSNLKAEKQLKITDNESFNQFLENCYINDYFIRQKKNSLLTQFISQQDKNSFQENSSNSSNVRSEQNSLKWIIREKLFFLFTNKDTQILHNKEAGECQKIQIQPQRQPSPEEQIKESTQIHKNLLQSNFSGNINQSNLLEDKDNNLLKKQYSLVQKQANINLEQQFQSQNFESKVIKIDQEQKNKLNFNLTNQKFLDTPKKLLVNSPSFQERYISNQSYQDLDDMSNQQPAQEQIKNLDLNKNQLNSNLFDQERFYSQNNQTSKNKMDSEAIFENLDNKQNNEQGQKEEKVRKQSIFLQKVQGAGSQKQNFKIKVESISKQVEFDIKQKTDLNQNEQKQNLLNIEQNSDQEEAVNVIYFQKKDGNESQKKYSLRQKYFKNSELYVVIILENESFRSKYEKEKRKNNILNAITSQQEDCVKESIQKIDQFIKQKSQSSVTFDEIIRQKQNHETGQQLSFQTQNFQFILSTCANLFIKNETYKMFGSFLRKQQIEVYSLKINLFSTAQIVANSLNNIYFNQSKMIIVELDKNETTQNNNQEILVFSDAIKLKILFYNLFNFFLESLDKNYVIRVKFSHQKSNNKSQFDQVSVSVFLPKEIDQHIFNNQNIFNLNYQSLYNDSQNIEFQYKPLWQLRTALKILTLLGPYNKIQLTQQENCTMFSFLVYQDIRILQNKNVRVIHNLLSEKKDFILSSQNQCKPPHIQANNISKLFNYNQLTDKKLLSFVNKK
ncbi:transmembrane protein, putative (macronuclear) [Tetrahymena thermophila SB210]|uniref:Transmembrane protein, putative n=1 Tax=Tetrahymena thermophila (strain SB210) TaxID=312017 RepID=I7MGP6_TETTS|nr:transmembrane protein, putative [Tetrahymena thermophila SB210]EAS01794.2 transmembrane protein, putative [Tetrahymena thermophila SB210]|eukprot:XP_001022039.2 transmembrane protein, putative [Tetrahymena thermophila SB210]